MPKIGIEEEEKKEEEKKEPVVRVGDATQTEIANGFSIINMTMRNAETGKLIWKDEDWKDALDGYKEAHIPSQILECKIVSREITFHSKEEINNFHLEQKIIFEGLLMEVWKFNFGFVPPNSTNTWQQTIEAAANRRMFPAELLSGRVTIETSFYNDKSVILNSTLLIYYDD